MKHTIIIATLFATMLCPAQNFDMEKDTIQMKEVVIRKKGRKLKVKTLEMKAPCYSPEKLHDISEVITLIEGLPDGHLESLNFYFNGIYSSRKTVKADENAELEVVLYYVGNDNMPAGQVSHEPITLEVSRKTGKVIVDLSGYNLKSEGKFYIGLREVTRNAENDFFIDCLCNGHDKYMTFARADENSGWERRWVCAALKIDVSVAY